MTEQTIVAVFDKVTDADAAVRELEAARVPSQAISRHEHATEKTTTSAPVRDEGFWARLFGTEPDYDTSVYDRSVERGASVVAVRVPGEGVDQVSMILESHNPIDLDEHSAQDVATGSTPGVVPGSMAASPTAGSITSGNTMTNTVQLAEETLAVGKRAVQGPTTRLRRFVVETPVEEQVTLRDETVTLERHPVTDGGHAGTADFADKVVEMTEMSEEAVVSKTARVVEEVNLRKDVTDRVETVKETLRRDDVEIENVPGESVNSRPSDTASSHAGGTTGHATGPSPKI